MEIKKSEKANLDKRRRERFLLGLVLALAMLFAALEFSTRSGDLSEENNFISYNLEASEVPKAVGQLSLFAVPVVILFYEGKEFHRQAKIIDFEELEYRIGQISEKY